MAGSIYPTKKIYNKKLHKKKMAQKTTNKRPKKKTNGLRHKTIKYISLTTEMMNGHYNVAVKTESQIEW